MASQSLSPTGKLPWVLLACAVSLAAISSQSLWIDEALTAAKAGAPDLASWWQAMLADKASDLQMPLYMIYVWGFAKVFGVSEWALRAANLPWFVCGVAAFISSFSNPRKIAVAAIALLSPFAWYYLDEARPYAMQLGASLMIVGAICQLGKTSEGHAREGFWVLVFFSGVIALSGSSLLGMIWAGAGCLALGIVVPRKRLVELERMNRVMVVISAVTLIVIARYYFWTLKLGARASDVGSTDLRNTFFIAYELLGFAGLGPGRLDIRGGGLGTFVPFAKLLVVYGVVVGDLLILGAWRLRGTVSKRTLVGLALVIALPAATILGAGVVEHFRVLGRHFTPLLPVVILVIALGLETRWSRPHWLSKPLVLGFMALSLVSCFSFRFAARHEKDAYRDAAGFANTALQSGKMVWWNAAKEGAVYYRVPLADETGNKQAAIWLMNPTLEKLSRLAVPGIIVTSKPDVFDGQGACAEYLRRGDYVKLVVLPAFVIWGRAGDVVDLNATRLAWDSPKYKPGR